MVAGEMPVHWVLCAWMFVKSCPFARFVNLVVRFHKANRKQTEASILFRPLLISCPFRVLGVIRGFLKEGNSPGTRHTKKARKSDARNKDRDFDRLASG